MTKKIAVVLAGCGAKDGAEIHESTMTLLAIDRSGASYQCFAPDIPQHHVINHITDEVMDESRNVLIEAARICRGNIKSLSQYSPDDYDAIIFPGGFGAAKNLFTLAIDGPDFSVDSSVQRAVLETNKAGKPIGALCISPVLIVKLLPGIKVTIGQDVETIAIIKEKLSSHHQETGHGEICIDHDNKIVTTPCYMLDASISNIADGAENLVRSVLELSIS